MKRGMTFESLMCRADLNFEVDFGVNGATGTIVTKWDLIAVNTKTREPKLPETENGSRKMKSREPLWLPYILGEQNSIDITTNDVKSLRNPIRTKTVYIQHCTGTQMAWHT